MQEVFTPISYGSGHCHSLPGVLELWKLFLWPPTSNIKKSLRQKWTIEPSTHDWTLTMNCELSIVHCVPPTITTTYLYSLHYIPPPTTLCKPSNILVSSADCKIRPDSRQSSIKGLFTLISEGKTSVETGECFSRSMTVIRSEWWLLYLNISVFQISRYPRPLTNWLIDRTDNNFLHQPDRSYS